MRKAQSDSRKTIARSNSRRSAKDEAAATVAGKPLPNHPTPPTSTQAANAARQPRELNERVSTPGGDADTFEASSGESGQRGQTRQSKKAAARRAPQEDYIRTSGQRSVVEWPDWRAAMRGRNQNQSRETRSDEAAGNPNHLNEGSAPGWRNEPGNSGWRDRVGESGWRNQHWDQRSEDVREMNERGRGYSPANQDPDWADAAGRDIEGRPDFASAGQRPRRPGHDPRFDRRARGRTAGGSDYPEAGYDREGAGVDTRSKTERDRDRGVWRSSGDPANDTDDRFFNEGPDERGSERAYGAGEKWGERGSYRRPSRRDYEEHDDRRSRYE